MTRISTTPIPIPIPKPDSVVFGELAISAGLAGNPVAVCFSESAADVDCELWKYFTQFAGRSRVLHVHNQTDVRKLRKAVGHWRLIVVHVSRLHQIVAWTVQMQDAAASARPTVFTRFVPDSAADVPLPLLVLRSTAEESSSIVHWLLTGRPQRTPLPEGESVNGMMIDPALVPLTVPDHLPNGRGPSSFRDCRLLASLLVGACLVGNTGRSAESTDSLTCGRDEYERVRRLLQSPLINTADEPVDQLAVDMVNRANTFLELKCNPEFIYAHPMLCDAGDPVHRQRGSRTRQELISRREVADLGNVRCRLIRQIVDCLRSLSDGYDKFCRMGLVRRPPNARDFKTSELRSLAVMLRSWSQKQVRSHFDALRKSGLITGERESGNAPWQYRLPEELSVALSPFRSLPPADELFPETGSSA